MSATLKVILEGELRNIPAIFQESAVNIENFKLTVQKAGEATGRMGEYSELAAQKALRGFWQVTRGIGLVDMALNRLEVSQMILASSQERLTYAQEKYGYGSRQAQLAADELARVTMYVERANIRAALSMGTFIVQLLLETGVLRGATLAKYAHALATGVASFATDLFNAKLATSIMLLSGLTVGAFALMSIFGMGVGAAAIAGAAGSVNIQTSATYEMNALESDIENAQRRERYRVMDEVRRAST